MEKIIVITAGAEPFLDFSGYKNAQNINIVHDFDVIDADELMCLIFVKADEYARSAERLRGKKNKTFVYSFVVFGPAPDSYAGWELQTISELRTSPLSGSELEFTINKSFMAMDKSLQAVLREKYSEAMLEDTRRDQDDLINIGRSLSIEKDPQKLLSLILYLSKKITGADAGSIYLMEEDEDKQKWLRFKVSETYGRNIPLTEFVMPLNKNSIAGYVGVTAKVLNIPDVSKVAEMNLGLTHNNSYDEQNNYITRSMLVVPMLNHHDEVIGVIQLINSKEELSDEYRGNEAFNVLLDSKEAFDRYVVPFNEKYNDLLQAIAGQAAVSIENNTMMIQIQTQFEEFVKASVNAIEARDPATSGHSFRVAEVCVAMAKAVNEVEDGYLGEFHFNDTAIKELEFAALLHDFGKVYIDLNIFRKEKKLFQKDFESLMMRLDYLYRCVELSFCMQKNSQSERDLLLAQIKDIKDKIKLLNEPSVMDGSPDEIIEEIIKKIKEIPCFYPDGADMDVVTINDKENLSIKRGSLNIEERKEIETHVTHTYNFVSRIPWPAGYKDIPEIALRHHEKLNGTGYPDRLAGRESTMLQSRMMAIADIYDALASSDRPYKSSVPMEKILIILKEEAANGTLDPDLVDIFINKKIYESVAKQHA